MTQPISYGRGRLNGLHAEPGTLVGPNAYGELLAVLANDADGVTVRLATQHDLDAAAGQPPRSITEARLHRSQHEQQQKAQAERTVSEPPRRPGPGPVPKGFLVPTVGRRRRRP